MSWEGDLDLKELAEAPIDPTDYALKESTKYRQMAGLSLLRTYIRERMARAGKTILDQKSAYRPKWIGNSKHIWRRPAGAVHCTATRGPA